MRYFLVIESTYFVDPHGEADFGGSKKFVSTEEKWAEYLDQNEEDTEEEEWYGSEDGYNAEYQSYSVKELDEFEYVVAKEIIENYNKL